MSKLVNLRRNQVEIEFLKDYHSRKKGDVIVEEKRLAKLFVEQKLAKYAGDDKKSPASKPKRKTTAKKSK